MHHRRSRPRRPRAQSLCQPLEPRRLFAAVPVGVAFDTAYGVDGLSVTDLTPNSFSSSVADAAITADGRARLVGTAGPRIAVVGLTPAGARDVAYGAAATPGVATFAADDTTVAGDAELLPTGHLLVSGYSIAHNGTSAPPQKGLIVRFTPDGRLDTTFGAAGASASGNAVPANTGVTFLPGSRRVDGFAVLPDGKLLVGGFLADDGRPGQFTSLWRLHPDGTVDPTFGLNGVVRFATNNQHDYLRPVVALPDGSALVLRETGAIRVDANGAPTGPFAAATPADAIRTIVAQPDGKFLVLRRRFVGERAADGTVGHVDVVVSRHFPDGMGDASFGGGASEVRIDWDRQDDEPADLYVQPDGKIVVGATSFHDATTSEDFALARLLPNGSRDASFGRGGILLHALESPATPGWAGYSDSVRRLLPAPGGRLIVAGLSHVPPSGTPQPASGRRFTAARYALDPALTIDPGGPYGPVPEGSYIVTSAAANYAGGAVTRYEWDDDYNGRLFTPDSAAPRAVLPLRDDDPPPRVMLRVTTSDGLRAEVPVPVTATNVAPTLRVTSDPAAAAGAPVSFSGVISDSAADTFHVHLDWGDDTQPVEWDPYFRTFGGTHVYARPGRYTATFTVTDDDGGTATAAVPVYVTDVAGVVYHDLLDDGRRDAADPGLARRADPPLAGRAVFLDLNDNGDADPGEPSALTDTQGVYRFDGIAPGKYTARVAPVTGWRFSRPASGGQQFTTGTAGARADFGLSQRSRITGTVFFDQDADGVRDPGEGPMQSAGPYADLDNDGRFDANEPRGDLLEPGSTKYYIPNLDPGTYTVRFVVENNAEHVATRPAGGHVVTVGPAEVAGDYDFGVALAQSYLVGSVFHDADGDGVPEGGENRVPGATVFVDADNDGSFDPGERSAVTDTGGGYRLGVLAGTHTLRLLPRDGWTQTSPPAGHVVNVPAGMTLTRFDFGARLTAPAAVVGRYLFYDGSAFDNPGRYHPRQADGALAPDKHALLPGGAATFANVSTFDRGINGVLIDVRRVPLSGVNTGARPSDFTIRTGRGGDPSTWAAGPAVRFVNTRPGDGAGGSDRLELVFDPGVLRDTWVQITVAANERTGLAKPDVFYFGHLTGAVAGGGAPADLTVDARDLAAIRRRASPFADRAAINDPLDLNRDGAVDAADVAIVRANQRHALQPFTAPAAAPVASLATAATKPRSTPPRRAAADLLA